MWCLYPLMQNGLCKSVSMNDMENITNKCNIITMSADGRVGCLFYNVLEEEELY